MKVGENEVATGKLNAKKDVTVKQTAEKDGNILTISVTGIAKGVKLCGLSYSYGINESLTAKSVTIDPAELNVTEGKVGYTKQLSASVSYNEIAETDKRVTWSSNTAEANISEKGLLTLKSTNGQAIITATSIALALDGKPISKTMNVVWSGLIEPTGVVFSEKGYTDSTALFEVEINSVTKIIFDKGTNSTNGPTYYTTGKAVRTYGGNKFKVVLSDASKRLSSITIGFGEKDGTNEITTDKLVFKSPTWTGSAQDVTFTIGGTKGHRRIASISVTYEDFVDTSAADALSFGT